MKHFCDFLVCLLAIYRLWHLTSPLMRREASRALAKVRLRVLAIILVPHRIAGARLLCACTSLDLKIFD